MVFEIIEEKYFIDRKVLLFFITGLITSFSLLLSFFIFREVIGIATNFLITIALTTFFYNYLKRKVKLNELRKERDLINKYSDVFQIYAILFFGIFVSTLIIQHIISNETLEKLFSTQINEIKRIRGSFLEKDSFQKIFYNNLSVLTATFILALFYCSASIFIISWNTIILSTAITMATKQNFVLVPLAILAYLPHGSLEFLAYFIGSVAGSLLSISFRSKNFKNILTDSVMLLTFAVAILFAAAFVEVILII